jgi:hypothetical protein
VPRERHRGDGAEGREADQRRLAGAWSLGEQHGERDEQRKVRKQVARQARERKDLVGPRENRSVDSERVEPERSAQATPGDPGQPERRGKEAEVQNVPDGEAVPVGKALRAAELAWKVPRELGRPSHPAEMLSQSPPIGPSALVSRCQ